MLIPNQIVKVKWNNNNKEWFESFGYTGYTRYKEFEVLANHLSPSSGITVKVKCDFCGETVDMSYAQYCKQIQKWNKSACRKCAMIYAGKLMRQRQAKKIWPKLENQCKKWGYTLVTKEEDYIDAHMKIQYICPKHGIQSVDIYNFLKGCQCFYCSYEHRVDSIKYSPEQVKEIFESVNNNILINSEEYKDSSTPNLRVLCGSCNYQHEFNVSLSNYVRTGLNRCPVCSKLEPLGERFIRLYLEANSIRFIPQYRFRDCKDKKTLPFDFYLPDYNLLIEFDGEGHYWAVFGENSFLKTKEHDKIKTEYCKKNNINLIRIPFWEKSNIKNILDEQLDKYKQKT